jgi:ubiquinone/menaquinone biosynthesis C-methylase UbiE
VKGFAHPETTATWDALYYSDPLALRFYDEAIGVVVDELKPAPGERVMDAGCGAGVHAIRAARAGCQVDAVDFSRAALEDAAARARLAGVERQIRFEFGDLTKLAIPDAAYRRIFSWGVLIHIPEIEKALDELVRILADGGRLALYISNQQGLLPRATRARRWLTGKSSTLQRLPMGFGTRVDFQGESIWVWYNDVDAIVEYLRQRGLALVSRRPGEFSDLHLRFTGQLRRGCLRLNNFWFDRKLPARHALMNLLVFEKTPTA